MPAIDDFTRCEVDRWHTYVRRCSERAVQPSRKPPTIERDALTQDDWTVIKRYMETLKPLKDATMTLQRDAGRNFGVI